MPRKVQRDAKALDTHVEPYVFSSDEETPGAKARPLRSKTGLTGTEEPSKFHRFSEPTKHDYSHTQTTSGPEYTPRPSRLASDLPWKSAYLPERNESEPGKHVQFVPSDADPDQRDRMTEAYLTPRDDSKREIVRMIHNHWAFKASYYILAQQELEAIHGHETLSRLKRMLHQMQANIDAEKRVQQALTKDGVHVTSGKGLSRARDHAEPAMTSRAFKAIFTDVQNILREVHAGDVPEWDAQYTHHDRYTKEDTTFQADQLPGMSRVVMARLFFAKRMLMRAVEHHLASHSPEAGNELMKFSRLGDKASADLARYRGELRDKHTRGPRSAAATDGPKKKRARKPRARKHGKPA